MPRRHGAAFADHIVRYAYALPLCHRKRVLDAGCKDGFGAIILSNVANLVGCADISWRDLEIAKKQHWESNVEFYQLDFEKDDLVGEWDIVVCFETIEHLQDPNHFLASVRDHLVPNGNFIFSVPENCYGILHKQVYDEQKIKELISKYFKITHFYKQERKPFTNDKTYHVQCFLGTAQKI